MMRRARARWDRVSVEDRAVLEYAFRDAMLNPLFVADYDLDYFYWREVGQVVQIHTLRIGDAHFILITTALGDFLYDFWVDADLAMAAE
jgi:hypothetical protein